MTNTCSETSGVLFGGIALAESWDDIAASFESLGPVVLGFLAFEGGLEILEDGLHDFGLGWCGAVDDKQVVAIGAC